ncbi:hypothetical protein PCANC_26314 [Puccinia coronata f. sp. avenae]|uniref:Uncharacterized protein n=1 Tax=Puccinia coronata f. sp. avenae TaxID=200324 RepID=A0A2N5TVJ5_9BASI|nr:hypothetical protein PCANC_26314 [Puccinia coronata f. sp. avenae]
MQTGNTQASWDLLDGNYQPHRGSHPLDLEHQDERLQQALRYPTGDTAYVGHRPETVPNPNMGIPPHSNSMYSNPTSHTTRINTAASMTNTSDTQQSQTDGPTGSSLGPIRSNAQTAGSRNAPYHYPGRRPPSGNPMSPTNVDQQSNSTKNVKAVVANQANPEEIVRIAEPLFHLPEHERWPAAVVMILSGHREVASRHNPANRGNRHSDETPAASAAPNLKTFLRTNMRQILLQPDLDIFSRKTGRIPRAAKNPFTLIKEMIDAQDKTFQEDNFPANWQDNAQAVDDLDTLIASTLKAKKNALANLIKAGLVGDKPVPVLWDLVADVYSSMHPHFRDANAVDINRSPMVTKSAKARLAYLRIMIHLNSLEQLFDGERPAGQVGELDAALPTEQQINAEVEQLLNNPEQQEAGEDQ